MDLPDKVGEYTLLNELGQGGFGIVFKAHDKNKHAVAVKVLQNLPMNRTLTEREVAIVDQVLDHENIVKIREHLTVRYRGFPLLCIVMEFCEGGDLNDYVIKKKPDLKERFNLMVDMSKGVLYLHGQNIVHRDLKPENVLLINPTGKRNVCKITDFGLSRIKEHKQEMFSTQCGTLAYIAPEIIDGKQYSSSVDVFALGLLFFAVYKNTTITDGFGEKALVPVITNMRFEFLNSIIRNERPTEQKFLDGYFKTSEEMGRLVYAMIRLKPDERLLMDNVLIQIVEARLRNDMNEQIISMKEEQSTLKAQIRKQESRLQEQEATIKHLREVPKHVNPVKEQGEDKRIMPSSPPVRDRKPRNPQLPTSPRRPQTSPGHLQHQNIPGNSPMQPLDRNEKRPTSAGNPLKPTAPVMSSRPWPPEPRPVKKTTSSPADTSSTIPPPAPVAGLDHYCMSK